MGVITGFGARLRARAKVAGAVVGCIAIVGCIDGLGISTLAGGSIGATSSTPQAPLSVALSQSGAGPDLQVTWKPSTLGTPATGAIVQLYQLTSTVPVTSKYLGALSCQASCTSMIFRELNFSVPYEALVWPTNTWGPGTATGSSFLNLTSSCPSGACVTIDATSSLGPANHAASGILHSVYPVGNDQADLAALHTTMFRSAPTTNTNGTYNWSTFNVAVAAGAKTTLVLSDLWSAANGGNPPTPWSNWSAYSTWMAQTIKTVMASGVQINYFEPYNEPGGGGYYSAANQATVTTPLLLQQFLVAYQAIRSVDPGAAIVGPSLAEWSDYPNQWGTAQSPNPMPDMVTFLNFAGANHIQLAAISWHEIVDNFGPSPTENTLLPVNIVDHVAEARALIAARPSLGNPQIFINEYGMPEVQLIPGWDVAYLSAFTQAQVNSAGRTCWSQNCANPTLDGLIGSDAATPWNGYYDRVVYAAMSGTMLNTTSTSDFVTALGSFNGTTVTGLIGRAVGCAEESWCTTTWPGNTLAPPTPVTVKVTVPWTSGTAQIALTDIPGQNLAPMPTPPSAVRSTAPITSIGGGKGTVTVTIPSFLDGDAYGLSITN